MIKNIEILIVNYNTPNLIDKILKTYKKYKYIEPIHIIDGSDINNKYKKLKDIIKKHNIKDLKLTHFDYNIHHGPGLHYGIMNSDYDYNLLMDSDSFFKKSQLFKEISTFDENTFGIGKIVIVDNKGLNNKKGNIKYLHPNACIINKEKYLKSESLKKHGAPFIETMKHMKFKIKENEKIMNYIDTTNNRGTCSIYGYNL